MKIIEKTYNRDSNFELLRIAAQMMIIFYHLIYFSESQGIVAGQFYRFIQMPLHGGVLLFVLMSGYFNIRLSSKGVIRLLGTLAIYYIPISIAYQLYKGGFDIISIMQNIFFLSNTPLWFVRTYLFLMLLSPVINNYLNIASLRERIFLIFSLVFMSIWIGTSIFPNAYIDSSVGDGKNIVNFMLLYVVGDTFRRYKNVICRLGIVKPILCWLIISIVPVGICCASNSEDLKRIVRLLCYPYNSPFLYVNALLIFAIFMQLKFKSQRVNAIAKSVLSVYIIHSTPVVMGVIMKGCYFITSFSSHAFFTLTYFALYVVVIFFLCFIVDYIVKKIFSMLNLKI